MKARVKATGDIIEVEKIGISSNTWALQSDSTVVFNDEELDINIEPDYWEKLKHQAAIYAMQGIINNDELLTALCRRKIETTISDIVTSNAIIIGTELVNKLKEESQCKK